MTPGSSAETTIQGPSPRLLVVVPLLARIRALDPRRFDWLLAGLFLIAGQIEIVFIVEGTLDERAAAHGIAAGVLVLGIRRSHPAVAALTLYGMFAAAELLAAPLTETISPFIAVLFGSWALGMFGDGTSRWVAAGLGSVLALVTTLLDAYDDNFVNFVMAPGFIVWAPLLLGRLVRERGHLNAVLRERVEALSTDRERALETAVIEERTSIAGELHDVVAHALSAMIIQAGAARRAAGVRDDHARESLAMVESTGRDALTELRAILGVLRRADEDIALAPQPSLAHVGSLVRRAQAAGATVHLEVEGERPFVPAGIDLTGYRLVQAALRRSIAVHEAAHAQVHVRYTPDRIEVEVADDVPIVVPRDDETAAFVGIQERISLYGGRLRLGTTNVGGRRVSAELPLEALA
jgi:signal transduction histidine kinase